MITTFFSLVLKCEYEYFVDSFVRHLKLYNVMFVDMFFCVWSYLAKHVLRNLESHCSIQHIRGGGTPYLSSSWHSRLWTFLKSLAVPSTPPPPPCFYGLLRELWIMSLSYSTFFSQLFHNKRLGTGDTCWVKLNNFYL